MKMVNLTPHAITFITDEGTVEVPPSGIVARVAAKTVAIGEVDGIAVTTTEFGEVENLPEQSDGVIYITSSLVAQRVDRDDVFIPNESVRDESGRIIGCRSLGRI